VSSAIKAGNWGDIKGTGECPHKRLERARKGAAELLRLTYAQPEFANGAE
jgi:hypothetical protein